MRFASIPNLVDPGHGIRRFARSVSNFSTETHSPNTRIAAVGPRLKFQLFSLLFIRGFSRPIEEQIWCTFLVRPCELCLARVQPDALCKFSVVNLRAQNRFFVNMGRDGTDNPSNETQNVVNSALLMARCSSSLASKVPFIPCIFL